MKVRYLHVILLSCIALLQVACVYDRLSESPLPSNVKVIELTLQSTNNESSNTDDTTIESEEDLLNENKVENFEVYFFNTDSTFHSKIDNENIKRINQENNTISLRISVPIDRVIDYENKVLHICVIANHTMSLPTTISLKQLHEIVEERVLNPKPAKAQSNFLMDGMVTTTIKWGTTQSFKDSLNLQRAAAKIRLRITNIQVKVGDVDYSIEGHPFVKIVNYTNKTNLLQGGKPYVIQANDWISEDYQEMSEISFPEGKSWTTNIPYYAYENNWREDRDKETYLMVKLNLKSGSNLAKTYYYHIPVNYRSPVTGIDETELYRLKRNYLYDITSNIESLGSEDETKPFEVESNIAIQPWIKSDIIDGSIQDIHYLMVKEKTPKMINTNSRELEYISDLPVSININKVSYKLYDQAARLVQVDWTGDGTTKTTTTEGELPVIEQDTIPFDNVTIEPNNENNKLTIKHPIPTNFVPFEIEFTIMQKGASPLSEVVVVTQYPGKYITGEKSPGFSAGTSIPAGADFRYHSFIGAMDFPERKPQINTVFYKITTLVNNDDEKIGDPVGSDEKTLRDPASNRLISPQFIIASQHGLCISTEQYIPNDRPVKPFWFGPVYTTAGYGPFNAEPDIKPYYHEKTNERIKQVFVKTYLTLEERCEQYFEGEYGTDGKYEEHYATKLLGYDSKGDPTFEYGSRMVEKKFKYQGRWRMPTKAEVELIDKLQKDPSSAVKYIMQGNEYFSAYPGWTYSFTTGQWDKDKDNQGGKRTGNIRCVFDVYKLNNHP